VRRLSACIAIVSVTLAAVAASGPAGASAGAIAKDHVLKNNRLTVTLDGTDPERVSSLTWKDGSGVTSPNLVAQGGPAQCTDPQEFFGQSYGAPEGTLPNVVVGGHLAKFKGTAMTGTNKSAATDCFGSAQIPVKTTYTLFTASRASDLQISRTVGFNSATGIFNDVGLRPYVPRVPVGQYTDDIYPNGAGTAVTDVNIFSCPGDCFVTKGSTWNGVWFADIDPANGYALIVMRDPTMKSKAEMTMNYDSFSSSNLSSFVLVQPGKGWTKPVTEVEHLCFEDLTSWPQTKRDAAKLPKGCGP
jgi:hypothetical protein